MMAIRKSGNGSLGGHRLSGTWTVRRQDATRPPVGLQRMQVDGESPVTNLPLPVTHLFGRSATVARLRGFISSHRMVTLTGPGGIGKTCLALKVARGVIGDFGDGGWLVELVSLSDSGLVPSAVIDVLGLELGGRQRSAEVVARAIGRRRLLLILDNCEHVIDAAAVLAETLLHLCPHVSILTTSREILRVPGEYVYRVAPLEAPPAEQVDSGAMLGHSAMELFISRTMALNSRFSARADDLPVIAAICRQLDGIPLAIELAAAQAASIGVAAVAASLTDRFALPSGGRPDPVQRTMLAALDWSYQLLSEQEQRLLRHLAIFAGGFTLDAASAVAQGTTSVGFPLLDHLANLVGKSLVTFDGSLLPCRWRLLQTIRAYALQKLSDCGERQAALSRHARYFRDLVAPSGGGSPWRLSANELSDRTRELDNVRAALDWCFSPSGDAEIGKDLTATCVSVWLYRALASECRERCERALQIADQNGATNARRQVRLRTGVGAALIATTGTADQTKAILTDAIEEAERLGDLETVTVGLFRLTPMLSARGEHNEARWAAERLARVAHTSTEPDVVVAADRVTGLLLLDSGRLSEARCCFERVLQFPAPREGERRLYWYHSDHRAVTRAMLARALCLQGFAERAHAEAEASVQDLPGPNRRLSVCRVIAIGRIRVALFTGDLAVADKAIARLSDVAAYSGAPFWQVEARFLHGMLLVARREFVRGAGELREAFDGCRRAGWRGSSLEFNGALAEAVGGLGQLDEALALVDQALATAFKDDRGQTWYIPELLRIKGTILLQQSVDHSVTQAANCFREAATMAREQNSLLWEIRTAISFARMRITQGCTEDARKILGPVYARFTEGFGTPYLCEAKALLEQISG